MMLKILVLLYKYLYNYNYFMIKYIFYYKIIYILFVINVILYLDILYCYIRWIIQAIQELVVAHIVPEVVFLQMDLWILHKIF